MRGVLFLIAFAALLTSCAAPMALAAEDSQNIVSKPIPAPEAQSQMLIESFLQDNGDAPDGADEGEGVRLSWWSWSDETGSDWPDDDAKARYGQLGLIGEPKTLYNGLPEESAARVLQLEQPLLELQGEIELVRDESGGIAISLPVVFTPGVNLSDSTVFSIFISEDRAVDHHGRVAHNLVRDLMPQIGFSLQANNSTETTWTVPSTHLLAAGIDFEAQPHGWHITLALFGGVEGEEEDRLISLYHTAMPTPWDGVSSGDFFLPGFLLLLCVVIASGAVMGSFKREKGMPKIDAQWTSSDPPLLQFRILAGSQQVTLNGCTCIEPWAIRGGFKRVKISAGHHHEFTIRFKRTEPQDCHISLNVEVDELGSWTQHLRLPSSRDGVRSVEDDGDEATAGDEA